VPAIAREKDTVDPKIEQQIRLLARENEML
jgi:hypothetical protein